MIRHVVMWKFKDSAEGKSKRENMEIVREQLYGLLPLIPQIKRMEVGFDMTGADTSMDLMLLTEFDTAADLKTYAVHPDHVKVATYVRSVVEARAVLDCDLEEDRV